MSQIQYTQNFAGAALPAGVTMDKRRSQGDLVIVRCWGDEAAVMRVWGATEGRVTLVAPLEYEAMLEGRSDLFPTSFPRNDVFQFDKAALEAAKRVNFATLRRY